MPNIGYITLSDIDNIISQEDFDPRYMNYNVNYLLHQQGLECSGRDWCLTLKGTVISKRDENGWVYVQHLEEE